MRENESRSALSAAEKVLQDAGQPLHYQEITKRVLSAGLWKTEGKTPAATINARLAVDVKMNGAASAFRRVGRGVFALNSKPAMNVRLSNSTSTQRPASRSVRKLKSGETLSFTDAAERVLETASGKPMHYRDITRHALDHRMLDTEGKTPEATMYAQVLTECKRRQRRGEQQRFMILGKGMISLTKWQHKGLTLQIEEANRKARKELLVKVKAMTPGEFEDLIGRLLAAMGFDEVEVTSRTKDGGIDVRGTLVVGDVIRIRLAVQVKRWKKNVQSPVIQQVRGSVGAHEQGLVITTSDFSKGAKKEAERADATPVGLMNGKQLIDLLVESEIGVNRIHQELIEVGEQLSAVEET